MRRLLLLLVPLAVVAACGDDDADDATPETTTTASEALDDPADDAERDAEDEDEAGTDTTVPETTVPDVAAEQRPEHGAGEDEGLDDPGLLHADLVGAAEVPGPGDDGAGGRFEAELVDGTLCVDMVVRALDAEVTAAHVHRGAAGEAGPLVVDLGAPTATDAGTATWSDVCVPVDQGLIEQVVVEPDQFHANVHSASHPDGAVRGQLALGSIFDRTLS